MGLRTYLQKRRFEHTPEPKGTPHRDKTKPLAFVVQEHHASQLHYDFRLELDGVLKSWAVPKGPSLNPHDHHLAVQVEDHPYEYRKFEGVIPEGNYGAGNVIIWDEGTYEPRQASNNPEAELRKGLKKGHLTFIVHGKKLRGEFALIQMHGRGDKNWLLVKKDDEFATTADVQQQDTSIKSGKKVDDLGAHGKLPDLSAYPKKAAPWQVKPMLCTLVDTPFSREGWLFEIKWDGYRAIASKQGEKFQLYSRNHIDFSEHYPPVFEALREIDHDVILDGEIVVLDEQGKPHFELLQNWRQQQQGTLAYYAFDVLWCDGQDVRTMPLHERKSLLKALAPKDSVIRFGDDVETEGEKLFEQMRAQGLEGVVAKRADSTYREGDRGADWLKFKTGQRQEVVIGGFTEPRGSREYLGALVVGVYDKGELVYVGHSGGGIPDEQRRLLRAKLDKLERKSSPFKVEPKPNAPVHWVQPKLVCEMSFTEWTSDGSMRHPKYEGLRPDKKPFAVRREKTHSTAKTVTKEAPVLKKSAASDKLELTHLDKVFFPKHGYTKGDLLDYYRNQADYILPYLTDRPLSLLRQPGGVTDHGFFQKNFEHLPAWVPFADIYSDSNQANLHWMVGGTLDTLLYALQLGSIEINPWNSRIKHLDKPDWLVIDLDPEGVTFKDVVQVAQTVKRVCDDWHIESYPKTSGKTGIHIFVPLGAKYNYEQAKNFAHLMALEINKREPKLTSVERLPAKRPHKIYVDFLQNREGQTLAAPYSVRPTPDATVSTPLHWDEVTPKLTPEQFTIKNTAKRLARTGDLWKPVLDTGIDLPKILDHLSQENSTQPPA